MGVDPWFSLTTLLRVLVALLLLLAVLPAAPSAQATLKIDVSCWESVQQVGATIDCSKDGYNLFFYRVGSGPTMAYCTEALHGLTPSESCVL
jgi:hypothetical protein